MASYPSYSPAYIPLFSLICKNAVRYEGQEPGTSQDKVRLMRVVCHGTENRETTEFVPPSPEVYQYIIFDKSDILDLYPSPPPQMYFQAAPGYFDPNQAFAPQYPQGGSGGQKPVDNKPSLSTGAPANAFPNPSTPPTAARAQPAPVQPAAPAQKPAEPAPTQQPAATPTPSQPAAAAPKPTQQAAPKETPKQDKPAPKAPAPAKEQAPAKPVVAEAKADDFFDAPALSADTPAAAPPSKSGPKSKGQQTSNQPSNKTENAWGAKGQAVQAQKNESRGAAKQPANQSQGQTQTQNQEGGRPNQNPRTNTAGGQQPRSNDGQQGGRPPRDNNQGGNRNQKGGRSNEQYQPKNTNQTGGSRPQNSGGNQGQQGNKGRSPNQQANAAPANAPAPKPAPPVSAWSVKGIGTAIVTGGAIPEAAVPQQQGSRGQSSGQNQSMAQKLGNQGGQNKQQGGSQQRPNQSQQSRGGRPPQGQQTNNNAPSNQQPRNDTRAQPTQPAQNNQPRQQGGQQDWRPKPASGGDAPAQAPAPAWGANKGGAASNNKPTTAVANKPTTSTAPVRGPTMSEMDLVAATAKFDKEQYFKHLDLGKNSPAAPDGEWDPFFDNISTELEDNAKVSKVKGGWQKQREQERRIDQETFGANEVQAYENSLHSRSHHGHDNKGGNRGGGAPSNSHHQRTAPQKQFQHNHGLAHNRPIQQQASRHHGQR